jgi:hypothetical protein
VPRIDDGNYSSFHEPREWEVTGVFNLPAIAATLALRQPRVLGSINGHHAYMTQSSHILECPLVCLVSSACGTGESLFIWTAYSRFICPVTQWPVKSRWKGGHVARRQRMRIPYSFRRGNLTATDGVWDFDVNSRILLKWILEIYSVRMWSRFKWHRTEFCEHRNLRFHKIGEVCEVLIGKPSIMQLLRILNDYSFLTTNCTNNSCYLPPLSE